MRLGLRVARRWRGSSAFWSTMRGLRWRDRRHKRHHLTRQLGRRLRNEPSAAMARTAPSSASQLLEPLLATTTSVAASQLRLTLVIWLAGTFGKASGAFTGAGAGATGVILGRGWRVSFSRDLQTYQCWKGHEAADLCGQLRTRSCRRTGGSGTAGGISSRERQRGTHEGCGWSGSSADLRRSARVQRAFH